jgi:hypothetical protein
MLVNSHGAEAALKGIVIRGAHFSWLKYEQLRHAAH